MDEPARSGSKNPLSALGSPWMAWTVAALVLFAGIATGWWLVGERNELQRRLAATRAELEVSMARTTALQVELRERTSENERSSEGLAACAEALGDQVELFNAMVGELRAAGDLDREEARTFHRRAVSLRRTANRSLEECRATLGEG